MPSLRSNLLRLTALSSSLLAFSPAQAQTQLPLWGFETGDLSEWETEGGASVVADDSLLLGGTTFELTAKGNFMAKILPRDQASCARRQRAFSA